MGHTFKKPPSDITSSTGMQSTGKQEKVDTLEHGDGQC
jgi:hypothetical protein